MIESNQLLNERHGVADFFSGVWTEVDVSSYNTPQPKPSDHWTDETWEYTRRTERINKILAFWAVQELVQDIGWLEHTSDWDWFMTITLNDGTVETWGCGTYFDTVTTEDRRTWHPHELLNDPGLHLREAYEAGGRSFTPTIPMDIAVDGFFETGDENWDDPNWEPNEQVKHYRILDIAKIQVGYDT